MMQTDISFNHSISRPRAYHLPDSYIGTLLLVAHVKQVYHLFQHHMSSHNSKVTEVLHLLVQNLLTYHHKLQVTFNSRNQAILPNNRVALRTPSDNQGYHAILLTIYLYI